MNIYRRLSSYIPCALLTFGCVIIANMSPLEAAYIYKNGVLLDEKYIAQGSCEDHFEKALHALHDHRYDDAKHELKTIIQSFPNASYAGDAPYYLGVIAFEESDLDIANRYFSEYLHKKSVPDHYEDTFRYKLAIGTRLAKGEMRHLFGYESLPKWMTGRQIALDIFNEIIKTLPYQELSAQAMIERGNLLTYREEYPKAIESYQEVIRKFPKSSFAIESYKAISQSYLEQLEREPQNMDALQLAKINLIEAKKMFPNAEEINTISTQLEMIHEGCATSLFEIGLLYERMKEPKAAVLCYDMVIQKYPSTSASSKAFDKMTELSSYADELLLANRRRAL